MSRPHGETENGECGTFGTLLPAYRVRFLGSLKRFFFDVERVPENKNGVHAHLL